MRQKITERREIILDFVQQYYITHDTIPSEREISEGTGISNASVHRILVELREAGKLSYDGRRSARTEEMERVSNRNVVPVLGYVACGPGQAEEQQFMEFIHMSESLTGKGEFFALIAKGESMADAGVHPGDYVIVRKQETAENGQLVIALLEGKNNLKKLVIEDRVILRSMNREHPEDYPDIIPEPGEELRIQGVAVGVYHRLGNMAHVNGQ